MTYRDERMQGDVVGDHSDQDSQKAVDAGYIQATPWDLFYIYMRFAYSSAASTFTWKT